MNKAREIAERLKHPSIRITEDSAFTCGTYCGERKFNPYENWNDCGMVLEALYSECFKKGIQLDFIESDSYKYAISLTDDNGIRCFWSNNFREVVCNAFLSMEVL